MIRTLSRIVLPALLLIGFAMEAAAQQPRGGASGQAQNQDQKGKPTTQAKGQGKPAAGAKPAQGQSKPAPGSASPGGGQATLVQSFGDWGVYTTANPKARVCYALSQPKARTPGNLKDLPGYMFVATRPAEKVRNEISLIMNFDLKEGVDHQAIMGRDQFVLVAKGKNLWVKNPAEEGRVVEAMKRANDLIVKGTSTKNNATSDRYSLKGFGEALERVQKECR
jgi:invasion protein IalB